jgi:hypothetical protein
MPTRQLLGSIQEVRLKFAVLAANSVRPRVSSMLKPLSREATKEVGIGYDRSRRL